MEDCCGDPKGSCPLWRFPRGLAAAQLPLSHALTLSFVSCIEDSHLLSPRPCRAHTSRQNQCRGCARRESALTIGEEMNNADWPFADPKNVAVFTVPAILRGDAIITHAYHHEEDGAWEFHSLGHSAEESDVKILCLEEIVSLDPTIKELASLPSGWEASRVVVGDRWLRKPIAH